MRVKLFLILTSIYIPHCLSASFNCNNVQLLQDAKRRENFCYDKKEKVTYSKICYKQSCEATSFYKNLKNNSLNKKLYQRQTCEDFKAITINYYDHQNNEYCFCSFSDDSKIDCNNLLI